MHTGAGSAHVTPVQGSALQPPFEHPNAHVTSVCGYEHAPAEHVPPAPYVWSVLPTHIGEGGVLHAIAVPEQTPLMQLSLVVQALPSSQRAPSAYAYEQLPLEHDPVGAKQTFGGVLHVTPAHASHAGQFAHARSARVYWHSPALQLPTGSSVTTVSESRQREAGGDVHAMPSHESWAASSWPPASRAIEASSSVTPASEVAMGPGTPAPPVAHEASITSARKAHTKRRLASSIASIYERGRQSPSAFVRKGTRPFGSCPGRTPVRAARCSDRRRARECGVLVGQKKQHLVHRAQLRGAPFHTHLRPQPFSGNCVAKRCVLAGEECQCECEGETIHDQSPITSVGVERLVVVPSPSWP
jgi:hypothetical protein